MKRRKILVILTKIKTALLIIGLLFLSVYLFTRHLLSTPVFANVKNNITLNMVSNNNSKVIYVSILMLLTSLIGFVISSRQKP